MPPHREGDGLRRLNAGDGTAAKNPSSAEKFKAERTGRPETSRETLREAVRRAVAGADSEEEFFTRLREAGVRVKLRHAPSGDALGYNVALPGDRNRDGDPVWYPGSKLAPDLSLPKIRLRLTDGAAEPSAPAVAADRTNWSPPARQRRNAVVIAERSVTLLERDEDGEAAAQLVGVGELLDAVAQTSPATTRAELAAAARAFERATRSHVRAERADTRALRSAARGIVQAGGALGRGEDGGTTAMLVSTLVLVTLAAARWHSARGHAQQAHASRQAAAHLRTAYRQAAATPMRVLHDQGRALPEAQRRTHEATLRAVLPEKVVRAGGMEARTDALVATLAQAERAGHDSEALLRQAIDMRELESADDVSDVLVWRLRRIAQLPAHPGDGARRPQAATRQATTPSNRTSERNTTAAAPLGTVQDPNRRSSRR